MDKDTRKLAIIDGSGGNDSLNGSADADVISGLGGQDFLTGNGGNDKLLGGDGDDRIIGGEGDDYVFAGQGQDEVVFFRGNDIIIGGTGNDVFNAYLDGQVPGPRGRQIFLYQQSTGEGNDDITGFDIALDAISVPEGTVVSQRAGNGLNTIVEFGNTRVTLIDCDCVNQVNIINNADVVGNRGNDDLPIDAIVGGVVGAVCALALFVFFVRRRRSNPTESDSEAGNYVPHNPSFMRPNAARDGIDSGGSATSLVSNVSNWFYNIYGSSVRMSASFSPKRVRNNRNDRNTGAPYKISFEEAETGYGEGTEENRPRKKKKKKGPGASDYSW